MHDSKHTQGTAGPLRERLLTIPEAAQHLSISPRALQSLIAHGRITVVRIGRRVAVHPHDLEQFIQARRVARPHPCNGAEEASHA